MLSFDTRRSNFMNLDGETFSVATVFVTALLGALLVFAGLQNSSIRAPLWWGAAQIIGAVGLALVTSRGAIPTLLDVADRALYRAKANGRNCVEATATRDDAAAPFARAPSIVPLIGQERVAAAGGRRRAAR